MTLDEYIIEYAEKVEDNSALLKYGDTEVFFSILCSNYPLKEGRVSSQDKLTIQLQTAKLPVGSMGIFFASKMDKRLSNKFGGMPLIKAIEMICSSPEVDGILIQSSEEAWISIVSEDLSRILERS